MWPGNLEPRKKQAGPARELSKPEAQGPKKPGFSAIALVEILCTARLEQNSG